ncbi:hypothetical protein AB1Y20_005234 [Prymnesium parvum]|uniref:mTERF domain-containing protein 1, mitochondrial n=1 Tax=Prymnesium parvum TaxID=97485 RepID=A0AB34J3P9_PRYPA
MARRASALLLAAWAAAGLHPLPSIPAMPSAGPADVRCGAVRCGAAAEVIQQHLGCSEEEALRAEARLNGRSLRPHRCAEVCEGLQLRLRLSAAQLRKVALTQPAILSLDFTVNLEPALTRLQQRIGLTDAELARVIVRLPAVLGYNFESNLSPKLDALQTRIGASTEELKSIVLSQPSVLGLSLERNIAPKLDFFQDEFSLTTEELRRYILKMPALLTYSLKNRYKPRLARCLKAGAPMEIVLDRISYTDTKFNASVPVDSGAWTIFV